MAKIVKITKANYEGMIPSKWPEIDPRDRKLHDRLYAKAESMRGQSRRERAVLHRSIHYLLERSA